MTLDQFINELIRQAEPLGYDTHRLTQMRDEYGTVSAVQELVEEGGSKSGIEHLSQLKLVEWCLENAVVRFAEYFPQRTVEVARARLNSIG